MSERRSDRTLPQPAATNSASGRVVLRPGAFNGVKIFSATMFATRDALGEQVTAWITAHPQLAPTEIVLTQSSDSAFHCITITLFYWEVLDKATERPPGAALAPRARSAR